MLPQAFFDRDTVEVARSLVGKYLIRQYGGVTLAAQITETEAYVGRTDKACHAYGCRRTQRTKTLFAPPGTAYVYLIYGLHCCLNIVTEPEGEPAAVLIRGGEAIAGQETMSRLRYGKPFEELTSYQRKNFLNGPGKLCQALGLTRRENGSSLLGEDLFLCDRLEDIGLITPSEDLAPFSVRTGPRVGIDYAQEAVHFPWRYRIAP